METNKISNESCNHDLYSNTNTFLDFTVFYGFLTNISLPIAVYLGAIDSIKNIEI